MLSSGLTFFHQIFELEQDLGAKAALLAEREQRATDLEKQLHKGNAVLKMSSEKLTELESKQGILESQVGWDNFSISILLYGQLVD